MNTSIKIFPAQNGDSILVYVDEKIILIDGGYVNTYNSYLKPELIEIKKAGKRLSHIIVTHIDADHISGINRLFTENASTPLIQIDNVWHNSYRHLQSFKKENSLHDINSGKSLASLAGRSYLANEIEGEKQISAEQGSSLAKLILNSGVKWNDEFNGNAISLNTKNVINMSDTLVVRILSPNNNKLEALYLNWRKELYKLNYVSKDEDGLFFDDAFEFILASEKPIKDVVEKNISHQELNLEDKANSEFQEDTKSANGSSIAFVLENKGKKFLFLGDAHPTLIAESLKQHYPTDSLPIKFETIKISHHGSAGNTSNELLKIIDSENFIISTNGKIFNHPDIETIARIIIRESKFKRTIIFNYSLPIHEQLNNPKLKEKYNYDLLINDCNKPIELNF